VVPVRSDRRGGGEVHHARQEPGGIIVTILLGIAGAVVGGFLSSKLFDWDVTGFNLPSFGIAVAGALLVLILYRLFTTSAKRVV
jgi:uncharacterized membrane protein YeaQ/YmgE (transglycosylase-associated protein family)